jgi:protein phosphatase PTC6
VRIPLRSAKHHYGAFVSRGSRPYNEDSHQAGVIELPSFAKKPPKSLRLGPNTSGEGVGGDGAGGDPQVFYFGVFDGHGGAECSDFLRERLHSYIEKSADEFHLRSSLQNTGQEMQPAVQAAEISKQGREALDNVQMVKGDDTENPKPGEGGSRASGRTTYAGDPPLIQHASRHTAQRLEKDLVRNWKELVGGYFRRFKPAYFSIYSGQQASVQTSDQVKESSKDDPPGVAIEEVLTYSFLKADYDFVSAQAAKETESDDHTRAERPLNDGDILGAPGIVSDHIGGLNRFKGGSTCSVALVSTPTPVPFWHPATSSSMLVAHVGDTRILVCSTSTGVAIPLTTNHHPSSPIEANRLRRYAATFVTDSFGEERISGLANTRAFGDIASKRIGVSAEPEIKRIELGAAEYSFMVLMSDGVSGTLSDQEIVDIVKEAKTPEQGARDVVNFAVEVSLEGDNATCLVVRMGGWERRQEGGHGSLGTKESRDFKREEASDPRNRRR